MDEIIGFMEYVNGSIPKMKSREIEKPSKPTEYEFVRWYYGLEEDKLFHFGYYGDQNSDIVYHEKKGVINIELLEFSYWMCFNEMTPKLPNYLLKYEVKEVLSNELKEDMVKLIKVPRWGKYSEEKPIPKAESTILVYREGVGISEYFYFGDTNDLKLIKALNRLDEGNIEYEYWMPRDDKFDIKYIKVE